MKSFSQFAGMTSESKQSCNVSIRGAKGSYTGCTVEIGAKNSVSGQPYTVRDSDGKVLLTVDIMDD